MAPEIPEHRQPKGYVTLYRGERPPGCRNVEQATPVVTAGLWFTIAMSYAQSHLSPGSAANLLRSILDIPWRQKPLKYPERYPGTWRVKGITIPEQAAKAFYCRNEFEDIGEQSLDARSRIEGLAVLRRVEYPMVRAKERLWRKAIKGRLPDDNQIVWLLPRAIAEQATVLFEGGHLECWQWCDDYVRRRRKPIAPAVDVSLDELEADLGKPQILERLNTVADPIPEAWTIRAVAQYPTIAPWAELLDGEGLDDVLELAAEVSKALEKRRG